MPTIQARVSTARQVLRDAGLSPSEAELSARLLAEHLLGWSREKMLVDAIEAEPPDFEERYGAVIARRAAREPLPYITGRREFWGLSFEVTPEVLIPRPETELIVEAALQVSDRRAALRIVDLCTGSGCVAVSIAHERPAASVLATDISETAVDVARRNAVRHGVADRVRCACADLLTGVDGGPFDLITANPPYVRSGDRPALQPEVREEPAIALFSGPEGLDLTRRLVADAPAALRPGGYLIFEFGLGQEVEIECLLGASQALTLVELRRDLQGIARTAIAKRG